jgi:exopolysaccharide biosynthesis polyprenyl glycosylphosphotransferase
VLITAGVGSALVAQRLLSDAVVCRVRRAGDGALRTVVVGSAPVARELLRTRALDDPATFSLLGYVDVAPRPEADALGDLAELVQVIDSHRVDTLVLSGDCDGEVCEAVLNVADAAGCHVLVAPHWTQAGNIEPTLIWQRGTPLFALTRPGLRGQQLILKRAFDLAAASVALVVLAPVLLVIAIAVRLSSPGPILFSQTRVGLGGRHFRIYKFRSMMADAESRRAELLSQSMYADERLFKIRDDPRTTTLGRFLRRTSLDELPQLWNVVRGDMSLVGPRPPVPDEVSLYNEHHYSRFSMKPGITGPWQVNGRNTITDFEHVVRIEKEYMRQWTFWKDLEILLKTVFVVLRMEGAH